MMCYNIVSSNFLEDGLYKFDFKGHVILISAEFMHNFRLYALCAYKSKASNAPVVQALWLIIIIL